MGIDGSSINLHFFGMTRAICASLRFSADWDAAPDGQWMKSEERKPTRIPGCGLYAGGRQPRKQSLQTIFYVWFDTKRIK
jgi:hypothetical protein